MRSAFAANIVYRDFHLSGRSLLNQSRSVSGAQSCIITLLLYGGNEALLPLHFEHVDDGSQLTRRSQIGADLDRCPYTEAVHEIFAWQVVWFIDKTVIPLNHPAAVLDRGEADHAGDLEGIIE